MVTLYSTVITLYSFVDTLYTNVNTLGGRNTLRFCPKGVKPILLYYLPQNLLFHSSTWLYFGWSSRLFQSQEGFSSVFQPRRPIPISFQLYWALYKVQFYKYTSSKKIMMKCDWVIQKYWVPCEFQKYCTFYQDDQTGVKPPSYTLWVGQYHVNKDYFFIIIQPY